MHRLLSNMLVLKTDKSCICQGISSCCSKEHLLRLDKLDWRTGSAWWPNFDGLQLTWMVQDSHSLTLVPPDGLPWSIVIYGIIHTQMKRSSGHSVIGRGTKRCQRTSCTKSPAVASVSAIVWYTPCMNRVRGKVTNRMSWWRVVIWSWSWGSWQEFDSTNTASGVPKDRRWALLCWERRRAHAPVPRRQSTKPTLFWGLTFVGLITLRLECGGRFN